jgi:hypothetical protein
MVLLRLDMEVSPGLGPKGSEGRERRAARSIGVRPPYITEMKG